MIFVMCVNSLHLYQPAKFILGRFFNLSIFFRSVHSQLTNDNFNIFNTHSYGAHICNKKLKSFYDTHTHTRANDPKHHTSQTRTCTHTNRIYKLYNKTNKRKTNGKPATTYTQKTTRRKYYKYNATSYYIPLQTNLQKKNHPHVDMRHYMRLNVKLCFHACP